MHPFAILINEIRRIYLVDGGYWDTADVSSAIYVRDCMSFTEYFFQKILHNYYDENKNYYGHVNLPLIYNEDRCDRDWLMFYDWHHGGCFDPIKHRRIYYVESINGNTDVKFHFKPPTTDWMDEQY